MSNGPKLNPFIKIKIGKIRYKDNINPKYRVGDLVAFVNTPDQEPWENSVIKITDVDIPAESYEFRVVKDPDAKMIGQYNFFHIDTLDKKSFLYQSVKYHLLWADLNGDE